MCVVGGQMDLPILLPGEVEITPFRVTLRERFRDVAQRIKVEFELPSDRDALFLVADGVRTSSKYMKGCPQGLLDPGTEQNTHTHTDTHTHTHNVNMIVWFLIVMKYRVYTRIHTHTHAYKHTNKHTKTQHIFFLPSFFFVTV